MNEAETDGVYEAVSDLVREAVSLFEYDCVYEAVSDLVLEAVSDLLADWE